MRKNVGSATTLKQRTVVLTVAVAALLAQACGGGGGGGGGNTNPTPTAVPDFDRNALLADYAQRIALPALRQFVTDAAGLVNATAALRQAAQSGPATSELDAARTAWRNAMRTWQLLEVMQVGPAGSASQVTGGQGLRDEIYSWPAVNPCRVDQETVSEDYADPGFFEQELVNTRGLGALEYLLFDTGDDNACPPTTDINTNGSWAALIASGDLLERRASYAALAADSVSERAVQLRNAWETTGGDFAGQLARAGQSNSPFDTAQDAVNDVFAGLFYLELDVKDEKMAPSAGISPDCQDDVCPNLSESIYADASKDHILRNLIAGQQIFHGGSGTAGVGFDDFLVARNASGLATQMTADFAAAITAVEAIPGTWIEALNSDPNSVIAAYDAVKEITDELKGQFATALNLRVPDEGAGDND